MNFDIKVVAGVVSLLVCFAGIASTWTLLQYRIDQLEKKMPYWKQILKNFLMNLD